jgi:hypothetical protein
MTKTTTTIAYRILSQPVLLFLLPCALSFFAWLIPMDWYGRIWRTADLDVGFASLGTLLLWYVEMVLLIGGASLLAARARRSEAAVDYDMKFQLWYFLISALAAAGLGYSIVQIVQERGAGFIVQALSRGTGNDLKSALYDHYAVGILSLRYLTIPAGGAAAAFIAIRFAGKERIKPPHLPLHVFNLFGLVVAVLLGSRLSLIAACVVAVVVLVRLGQRIGLRAVASAALGLALLLTLANVTRNQNFYAAAGIENPIQASMAEAITYLATSTQGSFVAADQLSSGLSGFNSGISAELQTNSAILEMTQSYGVWGVYLLAPFSCAIFAYLYVMAFRSSSLALITGAGAWGYAFCELWRIFLFQEGIFFVLLFFGLIVPFAINLYVEVLPLQRNRGVHAGGRLIARLGGLPGPKGPGTRTGWTRRTGL